MRLSRQQANKRILELLEALVDKFPDQRFTQLLFNADVLKTEVNHDGGPPVVINEYAIEPKDLLERVRNSKLWDHA